MSAPQTLLMAMPASSRLDDRELPLARAAPMTTNSTTAAPASAPAQTAGDAGDRVPVRANREHGAERRAGRDAERVRRRQRVAQHRLKQAAGQRQRAAREQPEQRPRQPQLREDRPVGLLARARHAREIERERADERQQQRRGDEQQRRSATARPRATGRRSTASLVADPGAGRRAAFDIVSRGENARSHPASSSAVAGPHVEGHAPVREHDRGACRTSAPD